jgi:hypothetical protein
MKSLSTPIWKEIERGCLPPGHKLGPSYTEVCVADGEFVIYTLRMKMIDFIHAKSFIAGVTHIAGASGART